MFNTIRSRSRTVLGSHSKSSLGSKPSSTTRTTLMKKTKGFLHNKKSPLSTTTTSSTNHFQFSSSKSTRHVYSPNNSFVITNNTIVQIPKSSITTANRSNSNGKTTTKLPSSSSSHPLASKTTTTSSSLNPPNAIIHQSASIKTKLTAMLTTTGFIGSSLGLLRTYSAPYATSVGTMPITNPPSSQQNTPLSTTIPPPFSPNTDDYHFEPHHKFPTPQGAKEAVKSEPLVKLPYVNTTKLPDKDYTPWGLSYEKLPDGIKRVIVVGDIHGCYDELIQLLESVDYDIQTDVLISLGDIVGKGPKATQVIDLFYNLQRYVVENIDKSTEFNPNTALPLTKKVKLEEETGNQKSDGEGDEQYTKSDQKKKHVPWQKFFSNALRLTNFTGLRSLFPPSSGRIFVASTQDIEGNTPYINNAFKLHQNSRVFVITGNHEKFLSSYVSFLHAKKFLPEESPLSSLSHTEVARDLFSLSTKKDFKWKKEKTFASMVFGLNGDFDDGSIKITPKSSKPIPDEPQTDRDESSEVSDVGSESELLDTNPETRNLDAKQLRRLQKALKKKERDVLQKLLIPSLSSDYNLFLTKAIENLSPSAFKSFYEERKKLIQGYRDEEHRIKASSRFQWLRMMPSYVFLPQVNLACIHAGIPPDSCMLYPKINDLKVKRSNTDNDGDNSSPISCTSDALCPAPYPNSLKDYYPPRELPNQIDYMAHIFENTRGALLLNARSVSPKPDDTAKLIQDNIRSEKIATLKRALETAQVLVPGKNTTSPVEVGNETTKATITKEQLLNIPPFITRTSILKSAYSLYDLKTRQAKEGGELPWAKAYSNRILNHQFTHPEDQSVYPHILFGHDAVNGLQIEPYATGLDTGCCYGKDLSGLVFHIDVNKKSNGFNQKVNYALLSQIYQRGDNTAPLKIGSFVDDYLLQPKNNNTSTDEEANDQTTSPPGLKRTSSNSPIPRNNNDDGETKMVVKRSGLGDVDLPPVVGRYSSQKDIHIQMNQTNSINIEKPVLIQVPSSQPKIRAKD